MDLEQVKMMTCLKTLTVSSAAATVPQGSNQEDVDYEALLDSLEEDLRVVHMVPLSQVKSALDKWVEAIVASPKLSLNSSRIRARSLWLQRSVSLPLSPRWFRGCGPRGNAAS